MHVPSSGPCVVLATANDLSSFSFYQRSTAAEFMPFFSKTVAERSPPGQRQSIQENIYTAHVYNRGAPEDLAGTSLPSSHVGLNSHYSTAVIVTDSEYPVRPAFSVLNKLLDEFSSKVPQSSYGKPSAISFSEITTYIQKYQDPRQADTIMRVQQELDETKIILVCPSILFGTISDLFL